jgi:hypothetical protein
MEIYKQGRISEALYVKYKTADYNLILNCRLLNEFLCNAYIRIALS